MIKIKPETELLTRLDKEDLDRIKEDNILYNKISKIPRNKFSYGNNTFKQFTNKEEMDKYLDYHCIFKSTGLNRINKKNFWIVIVTKGYIGISSRREAYSLAEWEYQKKEEMRGIKDQLAYVRTYIRNL